jgi:GNAT superfamily N-acetyltransferase
VDEIRSAETDDDLLACWPVMHQLRPHVGRDAFVARVREQQRTGYRLAFLRERDQVRAVAGYRFGLNLAWGSHLYVDDLATDGAERSRGHGGALFDWLVAQARAEGCAQLHLDSGVARFDAHRFYLLKRMRISSHHFVLDLGG